MTEPGQFDYRQPLYDGYILNKKHRNKPAYSIKDYHTWSDATKSRVMDWLPTDRNTPILDLGCGAGYFLYMLEQLDYTNLTGVDSGRDQISLARQFCPRTEIIQNDLRTILAQNPGTFGLISGFDVIEHFRKDEILPLFKVVAQALLPGGRLILQTPNAGSPWVGNVAYGDFTHEWFFTPTSLSNLLGEAGLTQFAARPCRPYVHGLKSFVRAFLWNLLDLSLMLVNLIETGRGGGGINTRVFLATAIKPCKAASNCS